MDDEKDILLKKIRLKKRAMSSYAQMHLPGEPTYDYAAAIASRVKRPCTTIEQGIVTMAL